MYTYAFTGNPIGEVIKQELYYLPAMLHSNQNSSQLNCPASPLVQARYQWSCAVYNRKPSYVDKDYICVWCGSKKCTHQKIIQSTKTSQQSEEEMRKALWSIGMGTNTVRNMANLEKWRYGYVNIKIKKFE